MKKRKYTRMNLKRVEDALREAEGVILYAARKLGCSRQHLYRYIERHPALQQVLQEIREGIIDEVQHALVQRARAGEPWAVKYLLTHWQPDLYGEKVRVEHAGTVRWDLSNEDLRAAYRIVLRAAGIDADRLRLPE